MQKGKDLTASQRKDLLEKLKARFEANMKRHAGLAWAAVRARLDANPEKLWSLEQMERTGGEPDVVGQDNVTKEYDADLSLKEYLEQVWAAVAKEALTMIFAGADATGFEEDARLTAMWLWTLKTGDANGAEDEAAFQQYLSQFVSSVKNHAEYLEAVGGTTHLASLKADPAYGYRPDLKRRRLA